MVLRYKNVLLVVVMFLLSYPLLGCYGLMLWPFWYRSLRLDENNEIRSISAMICQLKPLGHFVMSLANLLVFEVMSLEHKEVAWAYWVALQLVLCFDIDENQSLHFLFLLVYIVMLMLFWGLVARQYDLWVWLLPLWIATGLFTSVWFFNMLLAWYKARPVKKQGIAFKFDMIPGERRIAPERWKYESLQSVTEILWVGTVALATWRYEYVLRSEHGIKSDAYTI